MWGELVTGANWQWGELTVNPGISSGPAKSRNPQNPPPISRNPHAKKRNPTPATKSTATAPKANYRNPPALDREPRFLNVVANTCL